MASLAQWIAMNRFLGCACRRRIVLGSLRVALVVGTALNAVNQGSDLLSGSNISWPHVTLNYLVPYCVATCSAVKNQLTHGGGS